VATHRFPGTPGSTEHDGEEYELRPPDALPLYDALVDAKVLDWRVDCFMGRGFSLLDARVLAQRRAVDRAHVERLLDQGATHDQVRETVL
jgi:hypothetical protein